MDKIRTDALSERLLRSLAGRTSRRGMLARLGAALVAAPAFPLLPVSRAEAAKDRTAQGLTDFARHAQSKDDTNCDYWRYCAIDGSLCSCCGGGLHTCPPGTEPSPTSWVGTCINPDDGVAYLIAYRDCCGTAMCGQCGCDNTDRESQIYRPQANNDIYWCFGTASMEYHCSTAVLVGVAQ
ncbi:methylamine dehydrogenase (amicyanin) small subunit [Sphingomonas oleivorans]|uniref:Methylamine dehydrogenase (amicyanin) n=1 Tax=Sphingomonas oleivorans TaxID=1735121 RepID=A0A2T5FZ01_9SPHN|nr:methylamine dehydrogenase (amicyanin) small subunit [Sphingomonas oleivorans]PTQ11819.1 methylamine dehydrogenase (amicyanin) small subunit [Sphingomonas oleivorans]